MKYLYKYIVVCKWVESYKNPIILKKDEKVVVNLAIKETDPEWVNWVWCIAGNGMTGCTQESVHRQTTDKTKGPVFRLSLSFYLMPGSSLLSHSRQLHVAYCF